MHYVLNYSILQHQFQSLSIQSTSLSIKIPVNSIQVGVFSLLKTMLEIDIKLYTEYRKLKFLPK